MANKITLEEAEQLVGQLPPKEQIKLMEHIGERLGEKKILQNDEEQQRIEYAQKIKDFLKMSEEMAAETIDDIESAEDIRNIREERASRL